MHTKGKKGRIKKFTGRNNGPSRQRYWASHRLEMHKVSHLVRYNHMSRSEAVKYWNSVRIGRRK